MIPEFLKLHLLSLILDISIVADGCVINRMANNVDPDETARNEPSHLDMHCLERYLY